MRLSILDAKHPSYDCEHWEEVEALCKGGKEFKALIWKFLPQNPVEPQDVYYQRAAQAHYTSYMGSIINLYVGWLFTGSFSVNAYDKTTQAPVVTDEFYTEFHEDVGNETSLSSFVEDRFRAALTNHKSYWLIQRPSNDGVAPETAAEYDARGLGRASLTAIERHEVYDWQHDESGQFEWVILHTCYDVRESWAADRSLTVETWRVYDRENVFTYQYTYKKGQRTHDANFEVAQLGSAVPHGFKRVPVVCLHIPRELTIGEQVYAPQLEHFRLDNALSWLIRRTCYAQPLFNIEDGERPPTMGAGYAIVLGPNDKMGWTSPPVAPFDILQKTIDAKRDEIYRVVQQLAQSVSNNAETVGRSAASKEIDSASTRIMLNAYGVLVSKPIEETYEIISEARGEYSYEWSVDGFSGYDTATVGTLLANAHSARALGIPSTALHKELCTKVALAMLPEADQRIKDTIRQEISDSKFDVSSETLEQMAIEGTDGKKALDLAKAAAEPIKAAAVTTKADAAMKTASRKPTPALPPSG